MPRPPPPSRLPRPRRQSVSGSLAAGSRRARSGCWAPRCTPLPCASFAAPHRALPRHTRWRRGTARVHRRGRGSHTRQACSVCPGAAGRRFSVLYLSPATSDSAPPRSPPVVLRHTALPHTPPRMLHMGPARGRRTHQSARPCAASEAASKSGCCAGPSSRMTGRQRTSAHPRRRRRARGARRLACAACAAWRSGSRACTTARTSSVSALLQPVPYLPALAVDAAQLLWVLLARCLHAFAHCLRTLRKPLVCTASHLPLSASSVPGTRATRARPPPYHRGGYLYPVI